MAEAKMASLAKIAAAIANGRKSGGPKTEEGKRKSRMNALKHGLTAKTVLLPEEDPAEFRRLMLGWFESVRPQDQFEASLVERGVYANWQLDRADRSDSARLWLKAYSYAEDEKNRVADEVTGLVRQLLRAPSGRPAALPCTSVPGEDPARGTACRPVELGDHPTDLISALLKSGPGCRMLLDLWAELEASLEKDGWRVPERFRAFRLLGMHPSTSYMTMELASLIQACQALDPDAGSLVGEVWNEFVPADALPQLEAMYQREIGHMKTAPDRATARQYLIEIIKRETAVIAEKAQRHDEVAEAEGPLLPHRLAFDDSREGRLMTRYQNSCRTFFLRCLDELHKHRAAMAELRKQGLSARYHLPSPKWFQTLNANSLGEAAVAIASESRVERAVEQQEELSDGGASEREVGCVEAGRESESTGLTSDDDGSGGKDLRTEMSEGSGTDLHATECEYAAPERAEVVVGERRENEPRPRMVMAWPRVERGSATDTKTESNKERKRRRREERRRIREVAAVAG
jgi:hypothetical protein